MDIKIFRLNLIDQDKLTRINITLLGLKLLLSLHQELS